MMDTTVMTTMKTMTMMRLIITMTTITMTTTTTTTTIGRTGDNFCMLDALMRNRCLRNLVSVGEQR
eukprot:2394844-Karenia_brevis.AAC.1